MKFLLDTEADPRIRNRKRQSPLNLAQNSVIKRELQLAFDHLPPIIVTRKEVTSILSSSEYLYLTLVLLNLDVPCLYKQCRSRSVGF